MGSCFSLNKGLHKHMEMTLLAQYISITVSGEQGALHAALPLLAAEDRGMRRRLQPCSECVSRSLAIGCMQVSLGITLGSSSHILSCSQIMAQRYNRTCRKTNVTGVGKASAPIFFNNSTRTHTETQTHTHTQAQTPSSRSYFKMLVFFTEVF